MRLVVLASGSGTTLQAFLDATRDPAYGARVVAVGVDRDGTGAAQRAAAAGVPTFVVRVGDHPDRAAFDAALADAIAAHAPDLVVCAGYMKIVGPAVLDRFTLVNTHPALLPAFPGAHAVRDALAAGASVTGATVHYVDAGVDTGPVLAQVAVPIEAGDDEDAVTGRIKAVEAPLYVRVVRDLVRTGLPAHPSAVPQHAQEGTAMPRRPIARALVSVYDKTGLVELGQGLADAGVEIVSTGSTAATLEKAGVPVTHVTDVTGFPEILGGRVKTLHPHVHAGLLADLRSDDHVRQLHELGIKPFELAVVNLYPFRETVAAGGTVDEIVEQTDIGGPAMVRAAAKNHANVGVVVDPADYDLVVEAAKAGGFTEEERQRLAARAYAHTAAYDVAVASWYAAAYAPDAVAAESGFPDVVGAVWERAAVLRYGENPHQRAALYASPDSAAGLPQARQLHGKEMSFNNYVDTDAARRAAYDHVEPCVAIIKHANPCGIAVAGDLAEAHRKAHACDPVSAFGGVIATNRPVTVAMAEQVAEIFTEVVCAPAFEDGAVEILARKPSIRLLECPPRPNAPGVELRPIQGGLLLQSIDRLDAPGDDPAAWTLQAGEPADGATLRDLEFAWRAVRATKSNAILLAHDGATVGVGMGQVNRVDASRLAVQRAGERAVGAVGASDAFFPFADGFEVLAEAGVRAVVEPGGSVRDNLTIEAAQKAGVTLYFTGTRHFAH